MADFYSHSNERLQPAPNSRGGAFGRGILERMEPGQVRAIFRADRAARRGTWSLACTSNTRAARAKNRFSSPTVLTRRSAPCAVGHGSWPLMERVRPLPGNRGSDPKSAASCAGLTKAVVARIRMPLFVVDQVLRRHRPVSRWAGSPTAEDAGFSIDSGDPFSLHPRRRHRNLLRFALTLSRRRRQHRDLRQHVRKQPPREMTLSQQQPVVAGMSASKRGSAYGVHGGRCASTSETLNGNSILLQEINLCELLICVVNQ